MLKPASAVVATQATINKRDRGPDDPSSHLPDEPLVTIQPSKSWASLNIGEVWTSRELLYFLVWRDLKVRYKQTILGVAWVIMQPLLMTLVFTIFLGKLVRVPSNNIPYALLVLSGLLPWTFLSSAITGSSNSLVGNAHLITKVYFPRMIIPLAAVGARLFDFAISFIILCGLMIYYGFGVSWNILMLPVMVLLVTALAISIGMLTSALNVKYRDVGVGVPVLIQLWMFASPIVYPPELVPERWQMLYALNPLTGIITGFRTSLLGGSFQWTALAISTIVTVCLLVYAVYSFRRMERYFADIV
jgi:lipopolysaccharide transport system permease protein